MLDRLFSVLFLGCALLAVSVPPAAAQASNLDTVEGPNPGEETTLMITPYALTEEISARALGVSSSNGTRWAVTLIGVTSADSIGLSLGGDSLPIEEISRPDEDEIGPTRLYLSQETFLTIAQTPGVQLRVGDVTTPFPEQMRQQMQKIFERVT